MVPEGGFEPPTRGFSIRCSTPELLGLHGENRVEAQAIETPDVPWQAQKSVCIVVVEAIVIISGRPRHPVAIPQPLQQVTIFAALATKRRELRRHGLLAYRAFSPCNLMR